MYCRWRSNYQEEGVDIALTGITPPYGVPVLSLDIDFQRHMSCFFIAMFNVLR
jgi:hypothetical protein